MVRTQAEHKRVTHDFRCVGWTYTIWGGLILLSGLLIVIVAWKGDSWRREAETREALEWGN
jgi:hypothetical protein